MERMGQCYGHPLSSPYEREPLRSSPRATRARLTGAPGRIGEPARPGLPPDGAGSSALASATVALIKRTICLPLNQTQIPFPSNAPEASRDPGSPSRLHLLPQGPGLSFPCPLHYLPAPVWGKVCEREAGGDALPTGPCLPGLLEGPVPRTWGPTCLRVQTGSASPGQHAQVARAGGTL